MRNLFGLVALTLLATVAGCASDTDETTSSTNGTSGSAYGADLSASNPLASLEAKLTALKGTCTVTTGAVSINLDANGEAIIIAKHPVSSYLIVNGVNCNATTPILAKDVTSITVTGSAKDDVVIVDFTNGTFALKTTGGGGITVTDAASDDNDTLAFKGSPTADIVNYGDSKISITKDALADVSYSKIENHIASLGAGDDTFTANGFTGTDGLTVFGGAGNDTFDQGTAMTPKEKINGGDGTDTVSYAKREVDADSAIAVAFDTADMAGEAVAEADGNGVFGVKLTAGEWTSNEADTISSDVETVYGSKGNDLLKAPTTAGTVVHTLYGGEGDDTLYAGTLVSPEVLDGGAGNDALIDPATTSSGADSYVGGAGIDSVSYASRTDKLTLNMGGTAVSGAGYDTPTVKTDDEADKIGTDVENITGGTNNDIITGNTLDNVIHGGPGADTISGGTGVDTVSYTEKTTAVTVDLTLRTATQGATDDGDVAVPATKDTVAADIENVAGSLTAANTLTGSAGDNELIGGAVADTISGGAGNDIIDAGGDTANDNVITCGTDLDMVVNKGKESYATTDCEIVR
jgi:Ca2+-binding RTX toxin-like protein